MKSKSLLLASGLLLAVPFHSFGQAVTGATFTRVTTGAIVTDAAYSFGCAWGDYDGDGYLDLIVGNGLGDANALYHNERNGSFTRITTGPIATTIGDTDGVAWGDYDNDGNLDLFAANYQLPSFLFRGDGHGNFTRVIDGTMGANVADSVGCSWGDYDNDGFLDLVVANEGAGENPHLYRNNGVGTFTQILDGPVPNGGRQATPRWVDYDNDGKLDLSLFAGLSSDHNRLFHNEGAGTFSFGPSPPSGVNGGGSGDWGDYDNDGDLDLVVAHVGNPPGLNELQYRNNGDGTFTQIFEGPIPNSGGSSPDCAWGDYDNDGWLDLFVNNIYGQSNFLFHNNGDGTFRRVTEGDIVTVGGTNVGCAWGDYDNDGFLDVFISRGAEARETNLLYHNDGNNNRWLSVKCIGAASNRSGYGTKVRVEAVIAGITRWQLRDISSGTGYAASRPRAHFGLGDATNAETVRIEWPSGTVQELHNVAGNQILTVKEPPVLSALNKSETGAFQFSLRGGRGLPYTVEYSSNLTHWLRLTNLTVTEMMTPISDSAAPSAPSRFYRAWEGD